MKYFGTKFTAIAMFLVLWMGGAYAQSAGQQASQQGQSSSAQQSPPQNPAQQPAPSPVQQPGKQQTPPTSGSSSQELPDKVEPKQSEDTKNAKNPKRILGIIPNFVSTNDTVANQGPLTVHEKYVLAFHQMFDISAHIGNLLQSTVSQASNGQPHYGEGWASFGERFAASEGDQYTSSLFIYGVLPSVLHDDPRYFRRGSGSVASRLWYAATRTVITRKDSGQPTFNIPQTLGQLIQQSISTSYYPERDRTAGSVFGQWGIDLTYNSGYNMLREFMPDLGQYLAHRKQRKADQKAAQKAAAQSSVSASPKN